LISPLLYPGPPHPHPYLTGEDLVDPGVPPFRVWIPDRTALVLGYSQDPDKELHLEVVRETGIPVYRRKGGGGAVLLTPGSVCVGLRLPRRPGMGIPDFFAVANGFLQSFFQGELGLKVEPRGISDLAFGERKISGSSLYLPRECAVYLACILVATPLALMDRFLRHPSREPDYRRGRPHGEFAINVSEIPGLSFVTARWLREALEKALTSSASPL
jgi:lipoate-protein ligase A